MAAAFAGPYVRRQRPGGPARQPGDFFKAQIQMMQKSGDRRLTDRHFLLRQNGLEFSQRDIRLLRHQFPDPLLVRRQSISLVPAEFCRTDTAGFAVEPTEAYDRADTHAKLLRSFRYRSAILRRPNYAYTQILRIRLPPGQSIERTEPIEWARVF